MKKESLFTYIFQSLLWSLSESQIEYNQYTSNWTKIYDNNTGCYTWLFCNVQYGPLTYEINPILLYFNEKYNSVF
jgi:hypothetical protein